jgi:hypothetical protein
VKTLQNYMPELEKDILPPRHERKPVRDQLAHDTDVPAGVLHLFCGPDKTIQITLVHGGEDLQPPSYAHTLQCPTEPRAIAETNLTRTLRDQLTRVQNLMFAVYSDLELVSGLNM